MLNVSLRAEDEGIGARTRCQVVQVLGCQTVQPAQPVRPGDPQYAAVRAIDDTGTDGQRTLLGIRIAVMRGNSGVRAVGGDGSGLGE